MSIDWIWINIDWIWINQIKLNYFEYEFSCHLFSLLFSIWPLYVFLILTNNQSPIFRFHFTRDMYERLLELFVSILIQDLIFVLIIQVISWICNWLFIWESCLSLTLGLLALCCALTLRELYSLSLLMNGEGYD